MKNYENVLVEVVYFWEDVVRTSEELGSDETPRIPFDGLPTQNLFS